MRAYFFLIASQYGLWLVWSGRYTLDVHHHPQILVFGLLSVPAVILLCRRLGIVDDSIAPLQYAPDATRYWIWLIWRCIASSLEVLRAIILPSLVAPHTVRVRPLQEDDLFRTTYANSITLTPGTVTVNVEDECFVIHSLTRSNTADLRSGGMNERVRQFERDAKGLSSRDEEAG